MTTSKEGVELLADDPLQSPEGDLLDHERFAKQMAQVLDLMRSQTDSGVLALAGPWGSGKSSVLNMLEVRLGEGGWSAVAFNPWLLSDEASLIQQFFGSLSTALPSRRKGKKLREKLASYVAAVAPVARVVQLPLVDLGEAAEATAAFLAGDQGLDRKYQDLSDALRELEHPAVVLLDDLDRLHPDELILVFKLVRLIGRLPNIYYVLAFDEETVVDLLTTSAITGESLDRGYAFLEKIYQVRLELPPLHPTRRSQLVDLALQSFLERTGESFDDDDKFRFATSYHDFMAAHLSTPRQIKRYVAQAEIYYPFVQGEVDLVDFLLVTFLRASLPRLHDLVASSKNELTRTIESVFHREKRTLDQQRTEWEEKLGKAGIDESDVASAIRFLAQLFLPIRSIVELTQFSSDFYVHLAQRRRVGSADYFDRYFYLGVQPDDVSDRLVEAALTQLADGPGALVDELRAALATRSSAVFEKLVRGEAGLNGHQKSGVFHLLADAWDELSDEMFVSVKRRSIILGADLLREATPERVVADVLAEKPSSLLFAVEALTHLLRPNDGQQPPNLPDWLTAFKDEIVARAFDALNEAQGGPLEGQEEWVAPLLFRLRDITSTQVVRDWLQGHLEAPGWSVEEFAAALVPIATAYGGGRPVKVLAHTDVLESLGLLLPIEWVVERMTGIEEAGEPMDRLTMSEDDLTFENRIRHVKAVIRQRVKANELFDGPGAVQAKLEEE